MGNDKGLNDLMGSLHRMEVTEDQAEGGYVVSFPDLPE